jgi:RimJ/RimL family protein N-acetyltransferase
MNTVMWLSGALCVLGQAAADNEAALKDVLFPFYGREAAAYEFFLDKKHEQRLELQKQPVMTWTNAEKYMGAVFVWTYGGRPEVIGCIGSHQIRPGDSVVFHEFHSLSLQPLEPVQLGRGKQHWTPSRPGVELTAVEGAPAPSDSERSRLTQMRNIAREFSGWMKDNNDVTELRLLPQPIVRYKAPDQGVVDGAIFALVWKGTDPEILLILEDRKGEGDTRWHSALARFNFREMWAKRNDREVWRVEVARQNEVYITGQVGEVSQSEIRAAEPSTGK